jgi:hypothetical protein
MALPTINPGDAAIGVVTLGTLILWPRLGIRLPGHLPALLAGCAVMAWSTCSAACRHHRLAVPLYSGGRHSGQRHSAAAAAAGAAVGYARLQLYPELGLAAGAAACRLLHGDARGD